MPRLIRVDDFLVEIDDDLTVEIPAELNDELDDELDDGQLTELAALPSSHSKMGGSSIADKAIAGVNQVTERVSGTIASVCRYVHGAMESANRPDELEIKFALKLAGEAGIPYLTKGSGEAVLEIKATWKNPPGPVEGDGS